MDVSNLLKLILDIGVELLENGAETYRVEDTMTRMARAYGMEDMDAFVVPTSVILSITPPHGQALSKVRRIHSRKINLDRVDRINALCRTICKEVLPLDEAYTRLREIQREKPYSAYTSIFGASLLAFSFTLFYNGTMRDALCGAMIGAGLQVIRFFLGRLHSNGIFVNIIGGGFIMSLALLCGQMFAAQADKVAIGVLMILVPGVALTNSMRDLIAGDYMSGQTRLVEALLTATAIALGAGGVLSLAHFF